MESREGQGWRGLGLPVTQTGAPAQPQVIGEKDVVGRQRRFVISGFGITAGRIIRVGSARGDLIKNIGMPLGAAYLDVTLNPDEELLATAESGPGGGVEPLFWRVEILDERRG